MVMEADLVASLRRADAAGDRVGATRIARFIQAQRVAASPSASRPGDPRGQTIDPFTGYVTTAARAIPGLTELGAAPAALAGAVDDLAHGRSPDLSHGWQLARDRQRAAIDQFKADHPILSANATALGTVAPAALLGAPSLTRTGAAGLAAVTAKPAARGVVATARSAATNGARNAITGGLLGAASGLGEPGTLEQRARAGVDAIPGGAMSGAGLPAAVGAGGAVVRMTRNAFDTVVPRVAAAGSEAVDATSRAITGKSPAGQTKPLTDAEIAEGRRRAVIMLQTSGVTANQLLAAKAAAGDHLISTADAMGPSGAFLLRGISKRAGTSEIAKGAFQDILALNRPARLLAAIRASLGLEPAAVLGDARSMLDASEDADTDLWSAAHKTYPVFSKELQDLLNVHGMNDYMEDAASVARATDPDSESVGRFMPSIRIIDFAMKHLSERLGRYWDPKSGRYDSADPKVLFSEAHLGKMRQLLRTFPDGQLSPYGLALDSTGDLESTQQAYNAARGRVLSPSDDPDTFASWVDSLRPFEKRAAQTAAATDIYQRLSQDQAGSAIFALPTVATKMSTLFGQDSAADLIDRLRADDARMAAYQSPKGALGSFLPIITAARFPFDMATRNALGDILTQDPMITARMMNSFGSTPADPPSGSYAADPSSWPDYTNVANDVITDKY